MLSITFALVGYSHAGDRLNRKDVCLNEDSPFYLERVSNVVKVKLKNNNREEKVLYRRNPSSRSFLSKSGDWELEQKSLRKLVLLRASDSDEKVTFTCDL